MTRARRILPVAALATQLAACPSDDDDSSPAGDPEILDPEPPGAPTEIAAGRLGCLGDNAQPAPLGNSLELVGYARLLSDPEAMVEPPPARIDAYDDGGTPLATGFGDATKAGRVSLTVPIPEEGFTGWVRATYEGFIPHLFAVSRPVTTTDVDGWIWLATEVERDAAAAALGVELDPAEGILVGSVHDCDSFGVENAVVQVNGETAGVFYVEGFLPLTGRTFTGPSGRFVVPGVPAGTATVKAFGRLEAGGPLTSLSMAELPVEAGSMSGAGMEPRVGVLR